MHIIFGMKMDGGDWSDKSVSLGEICCGPAGMLSYLEGRLGLDGVKPSLPERINDYLQIIASVNPAWCKKSFELDSWSTAKQLLAWRDELMMAGWDGTSGTSERMKALAEIEARHPLGAGEPDRLKEVLRELEKVKWSGILKLVTAKEHLPFLWRKVIKAMEKAGLGIQDASNNDSRKAECICVTAPDEITLARNFVQYLAAGDNSQVAVIAEGDTHLLDGVLHQYGFGAIGHSKPSRWRNSLQILPLWLDLLWKPFNPKRFLELLTLPISPIRPSVCNMLSKVLRETPGMGGEAWNIGWNNLLETIRKNEHGYYKDPEAEVADIQKLRDFLENECFKAEKEVSGAAILSICDMMINRLGGQVKNHPAIGETLSQASTLKSIIDGTKKYGKITLERMLDTVIGSGVSGASHPEVTSFAVYSHPEAINRNYKVILWWDFVAQNKGGTYWTSDEKKACPGLASVDAERETNAWHRALGFAKEMVIAFTPGKLAGEEVAKHPLADEISFKELSVDSLVKNNGLWQLGGRTLQLQELQQDKETPKLEDFVAIAPNSIVPSSLSYTQMSSFLSCPFAWFMDKHLGLEKTSMLELSSGPLLLGNLAHKVVELLYPEGTEQLDPEKAFTQAGELFDALVPKMAAELLLDGRELEMKRIKNTLQRAIRELVLGINERGLLVKKTEKELHEEGKQSSFEGIPFKGRADIYLEDKEGNAFVIDLKWSSSSKYKDWVEKHKALQLASYAWLLRPDDCKADCAYYLFPKYEFYQAKDEDWKEIWNKANALWNPRMEAMHEGRLELGNPDDKEQLVIPDCKYCDYRSICGREVK